MQLPWSKLAAAMSGAPISKTQKGILRDRYINIVRRAWWSYIISRVCYVVLSNIITMAGIAITVLMSLDQIIYSGQPRTVTPFSYVVIALSAGLTLANKWLYLSDVHKKYIFGGQMVEKYISEGWSFMAGVDEYNAPDWDARFNTFMSRIEQVKLRSVELEAGGDVRERAGEVLAMAPAAADSDEESEEV